MFFEISMTEFCLFSGVGFYVVDFLLGRFTSVVWLGGGIRTLSNLKIFYQR